MDLIEIPIASSLFVLLFAASVIGYLRRRGALAGAVVLVFAASAPVFIGRLLDLVLAVDLPAPLASLSILGLLAQPVLTLRLAGMLHPVPRRIKWLAVGGYIATAVPIVVLPSPPPVVLTLAAVAVYGATALAAAIVFALAARRRTGSAKARLFVVSGATILMAATLLLAGAAAALPGDSALIQGLSRYGVLVAALTYAAAFMAPGWLRRNWQARAGYDLSRRLLSTSAESDPAITWLRFAELAARAAGVSGAVVLLGNTEHGARAVAHVGDAVTDQDVWDGVEFGFLLAQAEQIHQVSSARAAPAIRAFVEKGATRYVTLVGFDAPRDDKGLLVLAGERRSLFAHDDREVFEIVGVEAAVLADRARTSAERAELAETLRTTVEALSTASQAKSDFLASMSHELRTPLNAILGFSDLMRLEPETDGRRNVPAEWIDHVRVAGQHLLGLINDVLDLAKVEAGRLELRIERLVPAAAIGNAVGELRPLALQKGIALTTDVDLPEINADRSRLRQILYNLLSNAIKYTPDGGTVRIEGHASDSAVHISIVDSGVGIAAEDHERVFEEFTQVGDPQSRQAGTGLGLALTRRLVEAHGGHMELESAIGSGSRFTIVLPLATASASPVAAQVVPRSTIPEDAGQARPASHGGVLVIEDDPQAVALLRSYLEPDGYVLSAAGDGVLGIAAARKQRPAAILLDVLLPGVDGWEVLRRLKADEDLRGIPVLMITVVDDRDVGLALGAVDYLIKPVERNALLAALRRHVPDLAGPARPRVLAADDDPAALALVQAALESEGCEVVLAHGGREAVYAASDAPFDLIICDIVMPDLDGFEVVAQLKAARRTRETPILILTAQTLDETDKARLNGKIIGICEKGEDAAEHLRAWLQSVAPRRQERESAA